MLSTKELTVRCEQVQQRTVVLMDRVIEAAHEGQSLYELERDVFNRLLNMGLELTEMFIALQSDGDLGETVETPDERTLHRSDEPKTRRLRTIFGEHEFQQYVYSGEGGRGKTIELRPLDARLHLPRGVCSYLLEEFSQLFCVEQAFGLTARNLETVFGQSLPVDTLENVNQRMAESTEDFFEQRPAPEPVEEGHLTVMTSDVKGVPMVVEPTGNLLPFEEPLERPGNRKMATLGAVYTVDPYVRTRNEFVAAMFRDERDQPPSPRPALCGKQVRAEFTSFDPEAEMLIPGPYPIMSWLCEQTRRRDPGGERPLIRLLDGQKLLRDAGDVFLNASQSERLVDILDVIHVAGYV